MTDEVFTQTLDDNFDHVDWGNDGYLDRAELLLVIQNASASDALRVAAVRGYDAFRNLDVAHQTDLAKSLLQHQFETNRENDEVSREDLEDYPAKNLALVNLSPFVWALGDAEPSDIDAFLDSPGFEWADAAVAAGIQGSR